MCSTGKRLFHFYCLKKNETEKGITIKSLRSDNDVVDENVDELNEKFDDSMLHSGSN